MHEDYQPGDWIAFYRDGRIVVDEVAYPRVVPVGGPGYYPTRNSGQVREDSILEARRKP